MNVAYALACIERKLNRTLPLTHEFFIERWNTSKHRIVILCLSPNIMRNTFTLNKGKTVGIEIIVNLFKDDDLYVAHCPAIEIAGTGKTKGEARKDFEALLNIFIEETQKSGTLEKELLALGWTLRQTPVAKYDPPKAMKIPLKFKNTVSIGKFREELHLSFA